MLSFVPPSVLLAFLLQRCLTGWCARIPRISSAELLLSLLSPSLSGHIGLLCLRCSSDHEVMVWLWGGLSCWEQALVGMNFTLNYVVSLLSSFPCPIAAKAQI